MVVTQLDDLIKQLEAQVLAIDQNIAASQLKREQYCEELKSLEQFSDELKSLEELSNKDESPFESPAESPSENPANDPIKSAVKSPIKGPVKLYDSGYKSDTPQDDAKPFFQDPDNVLKWVGASDQEINILDLNSSVDNIVSSPQKSNECNDVTLDSDAIYAQLCSVSQNGDPDDRCLNDLNQDDEGPVELVQSEQSPKPSIDPFLEFLELLSTPTTVPEPKVQVGTTFKKPWIHFMYGPEEMYLDVLNNGKLQKRINQIHEIDNLERRMDPKEIKEKIICCAFKDGVPYRAKILDVMEKSAYVYFIDYGDRDTVEFDKIQCLDKSLFDDPAGVIRIKLEDVNVRDYDRDAALVIMEDVMFKKSKNYVEILREDKEYEREFKEEVTVYICDYFIYNYDLNIYEPLKERLQKALK